MASHSYFASECIQNLEEHAAEIRRNTPLSFWRESWNITCGSYQALGRKLLGIWERGTWHETWGVAGQFTILHLYLLLTTIGHIVALGLERHQWRGLGLKFIRK